MKKLILSALFLAPLLSFGQFKTKPSVLDKKTVSFSDTTKTLKTTAQPLNWPQAKTIRVSGSLFAAGAAIMAVGKMVSNQEAKTIDEIKRYSDIGVYSTVAGAALIVIGGGIMAAQK